MSAPQSLLPTQRLLSVLITFLTPLFFDGTNDIVTARALAIEAVGAFRIRNTWDLLTAVQIVAFSIAALGSICLSNSDGLSVGAILRCRSNANALQRTSDRAFDRLERRQVQEATQPEIAPLDEASLQDAMRDAAAAAEAVAAAYAGEAKPAPDEEAGLLALKEALDDYAARQAAIEQAAIEQAAIEQAAAEQAAAAEAAEPATPAIAAPSVPAQAAPAQAATAQAAPAQAAPMAAPAANAGVHAANARAPDAGMRMVYANAMATVAAEFAQEIRHLPPAEQRLHRARIGALSEVSQKLSRGEPLDSSLPPAFGLPPNPRK